MGHLRPDRLGGGPARPAAFRHARQKGWNVLLVSKDLGGKTNARLQLPSSVRHLVVDGEEVVNRNVSEISALESLWVPEWVDAVTRIPGGYRALTQRRSTYRARAFVVATGSEPVSLGVPGEGAHRMRGVGYPVYRSGPGHWL